MLCFSCTDFTGRDTGHVAAIIFAENPDHARQLLLQTLKGLDWDSEQTPEKWTFHFYTGSCNVEAQCEILATGDY